MVKAVNPKIDLEILVVSDGSPMIDAYQDRLTREGIPFQVLDLQAADRPALDDAYLTVPDAQAPHARFQGVIMPNSAPTGLSSTELESLYNYEAKFGVRQISAYVWPSAQHGMNTPAHSGPVDGMTASVTPAAKGDGYGYLRGAVKLDDIDSSVAESYGYLATPGNVSGTTVTPLMTAPIPGGSEQGVLSGVFSDGSREELFNTFASNKYQQHFQVLGHGQLEWLTRGVRLGEYNNWFSVHSDDVLMADALWNPEGNCTYGDDCDETKYPSTTPGSSARMTAADVQYQKSWQRQWNLSIDVVFNGDGTNQYKREKRTFFDPVLTAFQLSPGSFRYINHTYSHPYLGCEKVSTGLGTWECARDASGAVKYVDRNFITQQISSNTLFARLNGLALEPNSVVTGQHSGLKSLPQMPQDNPNLAPALSSTRTSWVASDASREKEQRAIGSALTVPRYPMNIYYNTATRAQAVDEYNWIYTSRADGGSGLCEDNPETSTCIAPLPIDTGFENYIVPIETRIALGHVVGNDPRPHYVHQSNQTQDRVVYPVLQEILTSYRAMFEANTPIVNPTMTQAGTALRNHATWAGENDASAYYWKGNVHVSATGNGASVPVSMPAGTTLQGKALPTKYAGKDTGWLAVTAGGTRTLGVKPVAWGAAPGVTVEEPQTFTRITVPKGPSTVEIAPEEPTSLEPATSHVE